MSWAVLFVSLLQPWCLSGIIMPKPSGTTATPSLQNDIILLREAVTSLQSTTGQLTTDLLTAKNEIQELKAELQQTSDELIQVKDQFFNLSETLASDTRDVAFHVSHPDTQQTTYTPVTFNRIVYNSGTGYNITSGTFMAPVSGTYLFWAQIELGEVNTFTNVWIMKTGRADIIASGWTSTDTSISDSTANVQVVQYLEMGEEIWLELTVEHIFEDNDTTYFGGALLSVH